MKHRILLTLFTIFLSAGAFAQQAAIDTIQIKGLIIVKGKTAEGKSVFKAYQDTAYARQKLKKNLHTKWLVVDLGFNNYRDKSDYPAAMIMSLHPGGGGAAYYPGVSYGQAYASKSFDYSGAALNNFAPRMASEPLTPAEFKVIPAKSINFNVWVIMQRLNIRKHKLNLIYALGLEMNNYRFARNITYVPGYSTTVIRDSVNFSKNKLYAQYLSVPLMLNFNSNPAKPGRSFEVSLGVQGGYLLKSRTKQVSEERGKVRLTDDFSLNKWRFGLTGEVAYGPIKLYSNFALTPLHDYGLEQYPFSVGFRFNGF
ncbi:outer membrane beta-barrel protein [Chitinophaga sp. YIM B06452]|uniref:outer membrane beta-barrel protein n=1 Tax=Chitinophaga sp. YIM B06452 TaxID=3082158 RepID=UPI0031FE5843